MSRRRRRPGGGIVGGTARYVANPVNFDGTNDYLTRGAGLTGEADSKLFSGSVWARRTSTGTLQRLLRSGGTSDTGVNFHQTDLFQVFGRNAANDTTILNLVSSAITDALWHHYMWSVDLSDTAKRHLYVDGVSDFTSFTHLDQAIDFTHADWGLGQRTAG